MNGASLRLVVALTPAELQDVLAGGSVVMQASSAHAVIFEVAVERREAPQAGRQPPMAPAPVPAAPLPPALPVGAWAGKYTPTPEQVEADRLRSIEEQIERQRRDLGYSP